MTMDSVDLQVSGGGAGPNPHPLPPTFSPSSLLKFRKCPLEWKQSYLPKAETPGSVATVKGNLFHGVLENLWMLPSQQRTLDVAHSLVEGQWEAMHAKDSTHWALLSDPTWVPSAEHVQFGLDHENSLIVEAATNRANGVIKPLLDKATDKNALLESVRGLLGNYFTLEDPSLGSSHFTPPFSEAIPAVEFEARSTFAGATFRGFVDRIDEHRDGFGYSLIVTDYKTGKQKFNQKFLEDYWWQQATYAVLLEDMFNVPVSQLRLVFPSGEGGGRQYSNGRIYVRPFTQSESKRHRLDLGYTYQSILTCWETDTWPLAAPDKEKLCNWCFFKDACPKFAQ